MASVNDEENVAHESVRRTRSGRKVITPAVSSPVKQRKRSTRKHTEDQVADTEPEIVEEVVCSYSVQSDIIKEMLAEAAQGVIGDEMSRDNVIAVVQDDGNTIEVVEEEVITDPIETIEEVVSESEMEMEMYVAQDVEDQVETVVIGGGVISVNNVDDDKSSSFPFGNAAQNENSDNGPNEAALAEETNTDECVESSLLASLAGDNANSLPSVGEEDGDAKNFVEKIVQSSQRDDDDDDDDDDESVSEPAIAEDTQNNSSDATLVNTEMVSEDELPMPTKPEVNDAEEVSDEELPAPARAELPADTEVVSEDELPTNGSSSGKKMDNALKRKAADEKASEEYNPSSPTSESNEAPIPEKKVKIDSEGEEQKEKKKEKERKKLPDLDKYWKAVKDDPADFTGWTYLLQYVDQETDVEAAREAYDAFLSHYPYCYGYWRKYADYEKRKGLKTKCNEPTLMGICCCNICAVELPLFLLDDDTVVVVSKHCLNSITLKCVKFIILLYNQQHTIRIWPTSDWYPHDAG